MKISNVLVLILVLLYISASTEWPTHTVCKEDNLEIYYKSCDPHQDFAFSIDHCSDVSTHTFNIRAAILLRKPPFCNPVGLIKNLYYQSINMRALLYAPSAERHSIKELYVKLNLIVNGKTVLTYSETLCEPGLSKLIFCGKKKGEHLYYEGPVTLGIKEIPQGDYAISAELTNEDQDTVACAYVTVKNYLDYY